MINPNVRVQLRQDQADQELIYYPQEGAPEAAATVVLYSSGSSVLQASAPATVDPTSGTTTTLHSAGSYEISFTPAIGSAAPIVGREYWVQTPTGRGYAVGCMAATASSITIDQPLAFDLPAGSTVRGLRLSVVADATTIGSTIRRAEAVWAFAVLDSSGNSRTYVQNYRFDVVLRPFEITMTEAEIEHFDPGFGEYAGARGGWQKLREGALADITYFLESQQIEPDLVRERRYLRRAMALRILQKLYLGFSDERYARFEALYHEALADFTASHAWYDSDDDLVADWGRSTGSELVISGSSMTITGPSETAEGLGLPAK